MSTLQTGPFEPYVPQLLLEWPASVRHRQIDGSLVHVDISGFTAMSERLAQKGKVGAEEVSAVLNNTFTELLTIAAELGGDLLKFGGDALLLLFTGEGHPVRAARASALMRARLRTVGKVQTPAGRVDLKMTVGVHSGWIDAFLVGTSHRELILAGPGSTTTVEVEEGAEAGEILLSLATAAHLPAGLLGDRKGPGVLLAKTPPAPDFDRAHIHCLEECRVFIPTALRPAIESPTDGEHRRITVGFIKFTGLDDLLESITPEDLAARLHDLVETTQEAVDEYGVSFLSTDIDANGGKIIVTGGVPTSSGADEEGVLLALRRIADRFSGIDLKIGVNRGPAFAGDIGAPFRRTYTVIGDAVNLSARVMGKAAPGEVLATGDVLDRSATRFDLTELPPFMVKGKTEPVHAWVVGEVAGRREESVASEIPLFGRDRELNHLRNRIVDDEPLGLIDICGAAGIGKSRFVRELRAAFPEFPWGFCDCAQYEAATPYYPFRRLLREIAGISLELDEVEAADAMVGLLTDNAPELLPWWPLLATVMDVPAEETLETAQIDPQFRQTKLNQTVASLIDAIFDTAGAIVIEDAQWIDDSSRDLLLHLAEYAQDRPWGIAVVHRPMDELITAPGVENVDLMPLEDEAASALARYVLADIPLLDHQLRDLVDRSGGNPLFLLELAEAVRTGEALPDNVETLIQARIDRLEPTARQLLRYGSVAGMTFDPDLLIDALGDLVQDAGKEGVWQELDEFLVRRSTGEYRFRQTLFHDVAYGGLSFRIRRRLHEQIGRALESHAENPDDEAAVLGQHFLLAGEYQEAWHYSATAGHHAARKHANVTATRLFQRAMEASRSAGVAPIEVASIAEALGNVAEPAGLLKDAEQAFRHASRLRKDDAVGRARLFRKLGYLRERAGLYPQALRWFSRGLKALAEIPDDDQVVLQRAELEIAYAGVRFRQARYREAIKWCRLALPDAEATGDWQALAHGYYLLSLSRQRSGDKTKAGHSERALSIYEELGELVGQAKVLNKLGVDAYYRGDWNDALDFYRRGKAAWEGAGDSVRAAMTSSNIALVLSDQGRLGEAEEAFRDALREFRAANDRWMVAVTTSNLGRIATRASRFQEGLELLEWAVAELRDIGAEHFAIDAESRVAENRILAGDIENGLELAEQLLQKLTSADDERHRLLHRLRASAAFATGNTTYARSELERGLEDARSKGNDYEVALYLDTLSCVCGGEVDESYQTEAAGIFSKLDVVSVPERMVCGFNIEVDRDGARPVPVA